MGSNKNDLYDQLHPHKSTKIKMYSLVNVKMC